MFYSVPIQTNSVFRPIALKFKCLDLGLSLAGWCLGLGLASWCLDPITGIKVYSLILT